MDFTLNKMVMLIENCNPKWVNIGSSTTTPKTPLPEPASGKIKELIERLKEITEVKTKPNLKRVMK